MLVNASSLVGTTAVTSGLGFVYWWIATRLFSPEAIGIASAAVSAMMLLGGISIIGLNTLLITELPRQPELAGSMISTALIVVGIIGVAIGLLFALFAPYISSGFQPLRASFIDVLTFSIGVALTAIILVLDQALIGLLKGTLQFWRNAFFAVIKIAAIFAIGFWPSSQEGMKIYATWIVSNLLSLGFIASSMTLRQNWRSKNYRPQWRLLRKLGFAALQHHLLNLTLQAPTLLLPILVTMLLSARVNAWFYVSWMIVSFVFIVPGALTIVLHAMNSAQQSSLGRKARLTIGIALVVTLLANLVLQFGAEQVLGLFGKTYAIQAAGSLRILVLAAFPLIIKNHYISICRIQDRIIKAMLGMLPGGLLELGAAALGAHLAGLLGLSLGWLIAISIEAILMFPTVYGVIRSVQTNQAEEAINQQQENAWRQDTASLLSTAKGYAGTEAVWLMDTFLLPAMRISGKEYMNRQIGRNKLKPPRLRPFTSGHLPSVKSQLLRKDVQRQNSTIFEDELL